MGQEIRETEGPVVTRKPKPYTPGEPNYRHQERKGILRKLLDKKLTKKQAVAEAAVILGGAATAAAAILARGEGKTQPNPDVNTGGSSGKVQTIDAHPTIGNPPTIPGVEFPKTPMPEAPTLTPAPTEKPTSTPIPTETPRPPENPLFARYDALAAKIEASGISTEMKSDLLNQLEQFKTIEAVQDQLMEAYFSELGPDGKTPALLYWEQQMWKSLPINLESQLFLKVNEGLIINQLRPMVDKLGQNFEAGQASELFKNFDTQAQYLPEKLDIGVYLPLSWYKYLANPEIAPKTSLNLEGLTADQAAILQEVQSRLAPITGNVTIESTDKPLSGSEGQKDLWEINFSSNRVVEHEVSHIEDFMVRPDILAYLKPSEVIHLATLRAKALTDPDFGIIYGTFEELTGDYKALTGYQATVSHYPLNTFASGSSPSGSENRYDNLPHSFAVNGAGEIVNNSAVIKILEATPGKIYPTASEFIAAKNTQLDALAQTSVFWRVVVERMKTDPGSIDRFASRMENARLDKVRNETAYVDFILGYYADPVFTVELINGNPDALVFFNSLGRSSQSALLRGVVERFNTANREMFAEGASFGLELANQPRTDNPYLAYFGYLKGIQSERLQ